MGEFEDMEAAFLNLEKKGASKKVSSESGYENDTPIAVDIQGLSPMKTIQIGDLIKFKDPGHPISLSIRSSTITRRFGGFKDIYLRIIAIGSEREPLMEADMYYYEACEHPVRIKSRVVFKANLGMNFELVENLENVLQLLEAETLAGVQEETLRITREQEELRKRQEEAQKKKEEALKKKEEAMSGKLQQIRDLVNEMYGDDGEFTALGPGEHMHGRYKYRITILFDDFEITNSSGQIHRIRELYINLYFDSDLRFEGHLWGNRGMMSWREWKAQYFHSHRRPDSAQGWNTFCLGSGTPMSYAVGGLATDGFNMNELQKILVNLMGYVRWESLEGGPHKRMATMREVGTRAASGIDYSSMKMAYLQFINEHKEWNFVKDNVTPSGRLKLYVDSNSAEFHKALLDMFPQYTSIMDSSGNFMDTSVDLRQVSADIKHLNRGRDTSSERLIYFKGKKIETLYYADSDLDSQNLNVVPNRSLVNFVAEEATKALNKNLIKKVKYEYASKQ